MIYWFAMCAIGVVAIGIVLGLVILVAKFIINLFKR